ncbi:hypothetical protein [Shewanella gaetbuli]|uniref:Uncharacterized protein n=1 Tax=Shewanella gaetbuli TaxID=220752 RepID=A0A9X1ZP04_9GAMM|nr:hypothetical protein [Shewanella gaetbuli]MCL1142960.1 hypothetical protein [Shewanella gaetbuli]
MLKKIGQLISDIQTSAHHARQLALIDDRLTLLETAVKRAHERLDLTNQRICHIEHYLGLRHHSFAPSEDAWDFYQVRNDVQKGKRPESKYFAAMRKKNAASAEHRHGTRKRKHAKAA